MKWLGRTRFFAWTVIVSMMLGLLLSGCGGNAAKDEAKKEFVIGAIGAMSGPSAQLGKNLRVGVELAVEDINAAGGINGQKVRVVFRDDEADPTKSLNLVKELVTKEKIDAFVGPTNTTCALAIQPYLNQSKIIQMNGGCTGTALIDVKKYPYSFRTYISDGNQAVAMVEYAINKGFKRIAIVHDTSALGAGAKADMEGTLKKHNREPIVDISYNVGDIDMLPAAQKLKEAQPDICLFFTLGVDGARLIKAMEKIDYVPPKTVVYGYTAVGMAAFRDLAGPVAKDVIVNSLKKVTWSDTDPGLPKVLDIAKRVIEKYGEKNDLIFSTMVSFYDSVQILKAGVEKAKSTNSDQIKVAIESLGTYDGLDADYQYSADNHDGCPPSAIAASNATISKNMMFKRIDK